ncbi:rhodanese-like domain-containing protein [Acidithiobacillus sp. AMEEHan]|uniref:rhodanese-like domain-containing protein n=1 Tax=Acidithiobacillus sp. AMEEHan TaxID=2994951 RepID=UPI0027E43E21|nr:rhodanese-like domain-containing protein [Acidithiobacillus sp. AMEEHan]
MYGFKEVTAEQLKEMQEKAQAFTLIDVRSPAEVARGMISGAKHIPLHLLPMSMAEIDKEKPLVFYCLSGGARRRLARSRPHKASRRCTICEVGFRAGPTALTPLSSPAYKNMLKYAELINKLKSLPCLAGKS